MNCGVHIAVNVSSFLSTIIILIGMISKEFLLFQGDFAYQNYSFNQTTDNRPTRIETARLSHKHSFNSSLDQFFL